MPFSISLDLAAPLIETAAVTDFDWLCLCDATDYNRMSTCEAASATMSNITVEIWIAISENGDCGVATDEDNAIENLKDGSDDDLAGTACRVVKLNVSMSEPHYPDHEDESDKPVDVTVPDDAGHIVEIETE
jgi:hypothetical protein